MMRAMKLFLGFAALCLATTSVSASVFLPFDGKKSMNSRSLLTTSHSNNSFNNDSIRRGELARLRRSYSTNHAAMAIPGYGVAEQVFVGGFANFLSIYNLLITARILLSWFPQAQGVGALQPLYGITDPFLNLFRGVIPPVFGLDLSPIAAFFLLNLVSNATAAVGAEVTPSMRMKLEKAYKKQFLPAKKQYKVLEF